MSYPVAGYHGNIASWQGSFNSAFLARLTPHRASINIAGADMDVTGLNASAAAAIAGLRQWDGSIESYAWGTPKLGNAGSVTFASGYVLWLDSFTVNIETIAVHDITPTSGTPTWRRFMPDATRWSVDMACKVDNTTAIGLPTAAGTAAATIAMYYGTSALLSGTGLVTASPVSVGAGSPSTVNYTVRGTAALSAVGNSSVFGSYTFGIPQWDQFNSTATKMVLSTGAGTVLSGMAFWRRISLVCSVGEPVGVTVDFQGTHTLTAA